MSATWAIVALVGAATFGIKGVGPVLLGGRELPRRLAGVVALLAPSLLAALVITQALASGRDLVIDARLFGLAAAAIALWRKAPMLVVVVVAAAATAIARALA